MSPLDVCVVVPTHNRRRELAACLRSVLAQADVSLEIVVVDDGSTDGTSEMLTAYADQGVRVVHHQQPRGQAPARNAGAAVATARWLAFIDDDDVWAPEKLASQLQAAGAADADFVYTGAVTFRSGEHLAEHDRAVPRPNDLQSLLVRCNPLPGGCSAQLIARSMFEELGGFDESFNYLSDWDLWLRVSSLCKAAAVDEELVGYRLHPGNKVANDSRGHEEEFHRLVEKHSALAAERGEAFDGVGFYYWLASGQLRAGNRFAAVKLHLEAARRYRSWKHLGSAVRTPFGPRVLGLRSTSRKPIPRPTWIEDPC